MSDLVFYITVGGLKMRDLDFIEKNSENWLKIKDVKYELSGIQLKKNEYMYVEFILKEVIDEMKNIKLNDSKINDAGTTAYYEWQNDKYVKKKHINGSFYINDKNYFVKNSCVDEAFICNIMINGIDIIDTNYYKKLSKNTRDWMDKYIYFC